MADPSAAVPIGLESDASTLLMLLCMKWLNGVCASFTWVFVTNLSVSLPLILTTFLCWWVGFYLIHDLRLLQSRHWKLALINFQFAGVYFNDLRVFLFCKSLIGMVRDGVMGVCNVMLAVFGCFTFKDYATSKPTEEQKKAEQMLSACLDARMREQDETEKNRDKHLKSLREGRTLVETACKLNWDNSPTHASSMQTTSNPTHSAGSVDRIAVQEQIAAVYRDCFPRSSYGNVQQQENFVTMNPSWSVQSPPIVNQVPTVLTQYSDLDGANNAKLGKRREMHHVDDMPMNPIELTQECKRLRDTVDLLKSQICAQSK